MLSHANMVASVVQSLAENHFAETASISTMLRPSICPACGRSFVRRQRRPSIILPAFDPEDVLRAIAREAGDGVPVGADHDSDADSSIRLVACTTPLIAAGDLWRSAHDRALLDRAAAASPNGFRGRFTA